MAEYDNRNTFILFKNKRKEKASHPDLSGTYTDGDGVEFWASGWKKVDKNGDTFVTGKIGELKEPAAPKPAKKRDSGMMDDQTSDIPW